MNQSNSIKANSPQRNITDSTEVNSLQVTPKTSQELSDQNLPLLPRSGWKDRRAFLSTMNRTKLLLEITEVEALLTKTSRD